MAFYYDKDGYRVEMPSTASPSVPTSQYYYDKDGYRVPMSSAKTSTATMPDFYYDQNGYRVEIPKTSDVEGLYSRYNELVGNAEKRYAQTGYRADYSTWKDQTATSTSELSSMSKNLRRKIDSYRTIYGDEYADSVAELLDGIDKGLVSLNDAANNDYKVFSQFADENEYNAALSTYEMQNKASSLGLDEIKTELKNLKKAKKVAERFDTLEKLVSNGGISQKEYERIKRDVENDLANLGYGGYSLEKLERWESVLADAENTSYGNFDVSKGSTNLEALKAELEKVTAKRDRVVELRGNILQKNRLNLTENKVKELEKEVKALSLDGSADADTILVSYNKRVDELKKQISGLEKDLQSAGKVQSFNALGAVMDPTSEFYNPDFDKYVQEGASSWNGKILEGVRSGKTAKELGISKDDYLRYKAMTDEEVKLYNYYNSSYYNSEYHNSKTQKTLIGEQYIDELDKSFNSLTARAAQAYYDEVLKDKSDVEKIFSSVGANLERWGQNLGRAFDAYVVGSINPNHYGKEYYRGDVSQGASAIAREDLGALGKVAYDALGAASYMLPSIATSAIVGTVSKSAGAATFANALTMGVPVAGQAYEEMINLGYSEEQAKTYGVLAGASEFTTELFLNGAGKGLGKTVEPFADSIGKVMGRFAIEHGSEINRFIAQAGSEAVEEMVQEVLDPILRTIATGDLHDGATIEEVLYSGLLGGITAMGINTVDVAFNKVSQAVANKNTEAFTQNEQVVFDKIVENRIAELEAKGEKVTSAEKKNIEKSVRQEFENGEISTSDIEEALGEAFFGVGENDKRILSSYRETALRGEKFSADLSKCSEKQRAIVQSAIDSGILNNSSRTHKFVDFVAKLAEDKGVNFSFINNQKLKESGFAIEGKDVAGYVKGNNIAVNIDSNKALNSIVGHEITHVLEGTELYDVLATAVKNYATTKGEWNSRLESTAELYSGISEDAEGELVADLIGDYLFTDSKFLERLSVEHRNVFQKLWDEVKYLCRIATAGSKEARQLEKVKKAFEDAYRNTKLAEKSTDTNSDGVRYAIREEAKAEVKKALEDKFYEGEIKLTENTPSILLSQKGVRDLPMLMKTSHIRENIFTEEEAKNRGLKVNKNINYHGLGDVLFFKVIDGLDSVTEAYRGTKNAENSERREKYFLLVSQYTDAAGDVINIPIYINEKGLYNRVMVDTNKLATVFGKEGFRKYIQRELQKGNLVRIKNRSTQASESTSPINADYGMNTSNTNISQNASGVNNNSMQSGRKNSLVSENQKAVGDYNIYGRDVKLASDEVVPVQERQSKTLQEEFEDFLSGTTDTEKKNDIFNSFRITKPNDYIHVQRQVFNTLKNEGFFTSEDSRSRTDVNEESGMVVETNKSGIDETFSLMNYKRLSTANKLLKLETVRRIPEIIRTGTLVGDNVSNYHNAKKGTTFAYIESKVEVGGKEVAVKIDIKKSPQKNKFWVHSVDILEKAGELPADVDTTLKQGKHYTDYDDSVTDAEENVNSISETEELLKAKLFNLQTELSNNQQNRTKTSESFDTQIQKLQEKYDSKKTKNSKVANDILRSIERAKRLKANVDADYAKRISDIESKIKNVNRELQKDHTELDRLQKAYRRIDGDLEQEKAELVKEFEKKRADAEKTKLGEETVYFKERARQLYNELERFEDWKVPSATLERILDLTYSEKDIKSALINISNVPSPVLADSTNPVETALRRILSEERANALENIEEGLNRELQDELSALETKAEEKKQLAHRANRARLKREQLAREVMTRLGNTMFWRDKKLGIQYMTNTERRNLQDIVRDEKGNLDLDRANAIDDWLMGEYNHNEASLNKESARIKKQFADMKINRVESEYIQMLGEFRHNPATTLEEQDVMNFYEKNHKKIDEEKVEKAIELARKVYDDLFERVNAVLREHGMKEIPYRKGYFPHFVEKKQGVIAKIFNWKKKNNDIPTDIAGITENFNPTKSYQSIDKQRKGDTTTYNFLEGLDRYVQGSLDWIYHIGDIQKRRAVESYIRYTHSEKGVQEQIDALENRDDLSADDFEREKQAIFAEKGNPLGRFLIDFRARTNTLAGKKSTYDRNMEEMINRDVYTTVQNIQARNSANIVVGSISSALTNLIPITQSWGEVSPLRSAEAILETIKACIRDDGVVEKSAFLTNRLRAAEKLNKTTWDKIIDKAGIMMEYIDLFSSQVIWRSKFNQNIAGGMGETEAIKNADQFSENVMAGRSRGNMPTAFDSKNLLLKCFTSFQLEVNNQYGYLFKDMPRDMKNKGLAKLTLGYVGVFVGAHLFNCVYSMLTGRDSAFDPLSIVGDLLKDLGIVGDEDDKEEKVSGAVVNLLENVVEEVPFLNIAVGGGRVPISSAIPYDTPWDFVAEGLVKDLVGGESPETFRNEMLRSLGYSVLPVGGGQIKKMVEGGLMYYTNDKRPIAGSYTDSGELRFTAEKDFLSVLQNVLFGQYSSSTARDYFDEGRSPLTDKQLNVFVQMGEDMTIQEYWDFLDEISAINKAKKKDSSIDAIKMKVEYIVSLDLPLSKKNILVNSILNRKDPVDLQGFGELSGFAEWDFSMRNPEKYQFLKDNGVAYQLYAYSEDTKESYGDDYQWYKSNPEKVTLSKAVAGTVVEYREIARKLNAIKADKDENGNPIPNSAKEKKIDYIDSLDELEHGAKLILYKDIYPGDDSVNDDIIEYVDGLDLTAEEKKIILKELELK